MESKLSAMKVDGNSFVLRWVMFGVFVLEMETRLDCKQSPFIR